MIHLKRNVVVSPHRTKIVVFVPHLPGVTVTDFAPFIPTRPLRTNNQMVTAEFVKSMNNRVLKHVAQSLGPRGIATLRRIAIAGAVFVSACGGSSQYQELYDALPPPSQTFMMIKDGQSADSILPYFATTTAGELNLCVTIRDEACSPQQTYPLKDVAAKDGRRILAVTSEVAATDERSYLVKHSNGKVVAEFRLVNKSANPVDAGLSLFSKSVLQRELTAITADELKGRLSATPENNVVADWLIGHLQRLGVKPVKGDDYRQRFTLSVGPTKGSETANIIGLIEGSDPALKNEYVVIGAHMDHAGTLTRGYTCSRGGQSDEICNGADDNGSGTITLLNVVKALTHAKSSLKRSVIVIWFTGEEEGLLGSYHYVRNPLVPLDKTVYMINLDMVGYMKSFGNSLAALGGGSSTFGKKIIAEIGKKYPATPVKISEKAGGGSDHVPFMAKGIPGVFFHTGVSNNPNYHKTSDSPDKIDYDGMVVAGKVAFETVYRVANEPISQDMLLTREPLVTPEEMTQSCHHLINNPFADQIRNTVDSVESIDFSTMRL